MGCTVFQLSMGAKQSQDSTTSGLPPPVSATSTGEERSVLIPSVFSPLVSGPSPEEAPSASTHRRDQDLEVPPAIPIRPFFSEQVPEEDDSLTAGLSGSQHQDRPRRHEERAQNGHHQDRHRHHHHHHHRRHQNHHSGNSHGRRAHRYLVGDGSSEPIGMEFDFSLASLNQRLRALQLRRENEESGSGSSSGGGASSSRHRSRSHSSRSHSRNQYSSSLPASSFFFMRPAERSKLIGGNGGVTPSGCVCSYRPIL